MLGVKGVTEVTEVEKATIGSGDSRDGRKFNKGH